MRTKEEIIDEMKEKMRRIFQADEEAGHFNKGRSAIVSPMGHFAEMLMAAAEPVIDLRDLLVPIVGPGALTGIGSLLKGFLKNQVAEQAWRQDALGAILKTLGDPTLSNLRKAASKLEKEKDDDADADSEAAPGHGRTDSHPEEAGQD